jgi:hypothetical protein
LAQSWVQPVDEALGDYLALLVVFVIGTIEAPIGGV